MLKHLQKYFGGNAPVDAALAVNDAQASNENEDVSMTTAVTTEGAGIASEASAALQEAVATLTSQLTAANQKIAELTAQVDAATEFKAAQEKAAAEAKAAARQAKLVEVVGSEQAVVLMAATAQMDDAAFESVVAAMSFKMTKEAADPAFKEVGADGNADATAVAANAGSRVMDYLKVIAKETQAE